MEMIIAVAIFVLCIVLFFFEKIDNTLISLGGAFALIVLGIISWEEAIASIDYETLALLLGLMFTVAVAFHSGIFSWLNTKIATKSRGNPIAVFLLFTALTAIASTVLNNVTVVILVIPLAIALATNLNLNTKLLVITLAMFSNIGGTLTLIGDPPNTLIGVQAGLSFISFIQNLWLPIIVMSVAGLGYLYLVYKPSFKSISGDLSQLFISTMAVRRIAYKYKGKELVKYVVIATIGVLLLTIVAFVVQPQLGISVGVIGMFAGLFLAAITGPFIKFQKVLKEVEWDSLLFFTGLFIQVGALEKVGFLSLITDFISGFSDNYAVLLLLIIWVIGLASTVINNIPFVALMIPVIFELQAKMTGQPDLDLLWWALALGACLGGNGTIIGSSAGYLAVKLAEKSGVKISFAEFSKIGMPVTIISLMVASLYILGRVYIF